MKTVQIAGRTPFVPRPSAWRRIAQSNVPVLQLALLIGTFVFGVATLPGFGSPVSIASVLVLASLAGLASVGQTVVILVGGFDLSVASFIVAGALMVTQIAVTFQLAFWQAFVVMIPLALVLGGAAGYLCHRFKIQPIIMTLAMGSVALGLAKVQSGPAVIGAAPPWLSYLTSPISATFGLPVPPIVMIWLLVGILMAIYLRRTTSGRRLYAAGANPRAASYSLIKTRRVWVAAFAFSALSSSIAGVALVAFAGNVDSNLGNPYLFMSLAAVIVGGTAFGGPGDYTRTMVGALLLTMITTVLVGHGLTGADQQVLFGAIILLAMAIYGREKSLRDLV